jgi:hypothetical protein
MIYNILGDILIKNSFFESNGAEDWMWENIGKLFYFLNIKES